MTHAPTDAPHASVRPDAAAPPAARQVWAEGSDAPSGEGWLARDSPEQWTHTPPSSSSSPSGVAHDEYDDDDDYDEYDDDGEPLQVV